MTVYDQLILRVLNVMYFKDIEEKHQGRKNLFCFVIVIKFI